MITVACVRVKANVPYGVEYVTRLQGMVARHLSQAHRFVCLTDAVDELPVGIEGIEIPNPLPLAGWWSKMRLFDRSMPFDSRVLYLDLDTLVVNSLDPIADYASHFALIPHAGNFQPRNGLKVVQRFNSSVMVWTVRQNWRLFDGWTPAVADRLWGDQDYLGEMCPGADTMPLEWFPRLSSIQAGPVPAGARVVLAKKPKPLEAAAKWPWVRDAWRAA